MKKLLTILNIIIILFLVTNKSFAQKAPIQSDEKAFYKNILKDSTKIEKVVQIMKTYKESMEKVENNHEYTLEQKRSLFKNLIEEKNILLKKFLNTEELSKLIPSTEKTKTNENDEQPLP